jgi:hypothetical protein
VPFPFAVPEATVAALRWKSDVWTANPYTFRGRTLWGFVSNGGPALETNGTIDIGVDGLVVPEQAQLPSLDLTVDLYVGSPAVFGEISFSVPIALDASTNSLIASIQPPSNTVYLSAGDEAYPNTITVVLQNGPTPLPQGSNSVVTIELPITETIAPNTDAITTAARRTKIACSVPSASGTTWTHDVTTPLTPGNVAFSITPESSPALPAGGTLVVDLTTIVSPLPSGTASIRVDASGFDGFPATTTDCPVLLEPLPVPTFSRVPDVVGAQPLAFDSPLAIQWAAEYTTSLTLEYDDGIAPITLTSEKDGLPFSTEAAGYALSNATVPATARLTAANVANGMVRHSLPIDVAPTPTAFTVEAVPAVWDFDAGPVSVTYAISATPDRLVTALSVSGPPGTEPLTNRSAYTVHQSSAIVLTFEATFGNGVERAPIDAPPVTVSVASLASYLTGTKWRKSLPLPAVYTFGPDGRGFCDTGTVTWATTYTASANQVVIRDDQGGFLDVFFWSPPTLSTAEEPLTRLDG